MHERINQYQSSARCYVQGQIGSFPLQLHRPMTSAVHLLPPELNWYLAGNASIVVAHQIIVGWPRLDSDPTSRQRCSRGRSSLALALRSHNWCPPAAVPSTRVAATPTQDHLLRDLHRC